MGPTQQKICEVCNRKKKNVKIRESDRNECDECSNIRKNELQRIRKEKEQSSMTTPTSPRHISTLTLPSPSQRPISYENTIETNVETTSPRTIISRNNPLPSNHTQQQLHDTDFSSTRKDECEICGTSNNDVLVRDNGRNECVECYIKTTDSEQSQSVDDHLQQTQVTDVAAPTKEITSCQKCNKTTEHWVQCELCDLWLCYMCAELNKTQFKTMVRAKAQQIGLRFFCNKCNTEMDKVLENYKKENNIQHNVLQIHSTNDTEIYAEEANDARKTTRQTPDSGNAPEAIFNKPPHTTNKQTQNVQKNSETTNINLKIENLEEKFEEKFNHLEECIHAILSATSQGINKSMETKPTYAKIVANQSQPYKSVSYAEKTYPGTVTTEMPAITRPKIMQRNANPTESRPPPIYPGTVTTEMPAITRPRIMQRNANPTESRPPPIQISRQSSSVSLANGMNREITQETIINTFEEFQNREKRRNNLIIYGLPENGYIPTQLSQLAQELNISGTEITNYTRLGQKNQYKPRPLLITVKDLDKRQAFLINGKNLRASMSYLKNVYISPDYTPKEREHNKLLVDELRYRRSNGEDNLIIRRGKLVERNRPAQMVSFNI